MANRISISSGIRWFSIGGGGLCLLLAVLSCPYAMGYKKTTGFIRSIQEDRDESGKPVTTVSVTYTRYSGTDTWQVGHSFPLEQLPSDCKVGDSLTLFFDPDHKNAWLASSIWNYPILGFALGGLLVAIGCFAPRRQTPKPLEVIL